MKTLLIEMVAGVLFLVSGCSALMDTPAQELARSRWTACHAKITGAELNTVQPDGRITFWYNGAGDGQSMLACLHAAAPTGRDLPEPIAQLRPAGSGGGGGGGGSM